MEKQVIELFGMVFRILIRYWANDNKVASQNLIDFEQFAQKCGLNFLDAQKFDLSIHEYLLEISKSFLEETGGTIESLERKEEILNQILRDVAKIDINEGKVACDFSKPEVLQNAIIKAGEVDRATWSDKENAVYTNCVRYISKSCVDFVSRWPSFTPEALKVIIQRQSEYHKDIQLILEEIRNMQTLFEIAYKDFENTKELSIVGSLDRFSATNEGIIECQDKVSKKDLSLAERFIVGQDIETMQDYSVRDINDAFNAAQQYYVSCITPFETSCSWYEKQLFQNIKTFDTSVRFVCSQEAYESTCEYIIKERYLDVIKAVKYGLDYADSVPSIFWEAEYQLSECERRMMEVAQNCQKQLATCTISDNEINQYSLFALLKNGYVLSDLYKKHYNIDSLVRFGLEREDLQEYYSEEELENAIKRAEELFDKIETPELGKYAGFGPNYLAAKFDAESVLGVFAVEEIYHAYSLQDVLKIEPMVSPKSLKRGQYSAEELFEVGFSLRQLAAAGFETKELTTTYKIREDTNLDEIQEVVDEIIYELEEEEYSEYFLCNSADAELLKRLKEKGFLLGQVRKCLPFMIESCPCHVKWLLMARYTIDELEKERVEWKEYFKNLPPEWIDNEEYEKYQYDGVLPLELLKAGVRIEQIESTYGIKNYMYDIQEIKELDVCTLREQGFTAKTFCCMGKSLEEVKKAYSCESADDICEMALSWYDLKELRKAGFSIGKMKVQYEKILNSFDLRKDTSIGTRYGMIINFINKHGE